MHWITRVTVSGSVSNGDAEEKTHHAYEIVAMPMNCSGMYRGVVREDGVPKTAIFDDDELE